MALRNGRFIFIVLQLEFQAPRSRKAKGCYTSLKVAAFFPLNMTF
ncbi:hypothetical protein [Siminovitchia fortis]|nr:hypothetical protein [Siminovitchia fortis]WHY83449.1 hypothetical protein QNH23_08810 [Siminovitchia fortis]